MVAYMDKNIGRIVKKLEELNLRQRTLLLFLGDNGTQRSIQSQFGDKTIIGGKSWLTEAGTHVPMIANWPGVIPKERIVDTLVDPTDFLPTIAEVTGAKPPAGRTIDGVSFLPVLKGQKDQVRDWILIEYINEHRPMFRGNEGRYIRNHRWKLYDRGTSKRGEPFYKGGQLFDIIRDPDEKYPLDSNSDYNESSTARRKLQTILDKLSKDKKL